VGRGEGEMAAGPRAEQLCDISSGHIIERTIERRPPNPTTCTTGGST
jgi:hypothetical protein